MTTTANYPNAIAGEMPSGLDKQHVLGQFLTPNPVAEFVASLFEIHRSEMHLLDAGAGAGGKASVLNNHTIFNALDSPLHKSRFCGSVVATGPSFNGVFLPN